MGVRAALTVALGSLGLGACSLALDFELDGAETAAAGNCGDRLDNDSDGLFDQADPGCFVDEATSALCSDGLDNDGDGLVDIADVGCWAFVARPGISRCARVRGTNLTPSFDPNDAEWSGTGSFEPVETGLWELAGGEDARLLLGPMITGAMDTLEVEVSVDMTSEAFEQPGARIVSLVRARDVADSVVPDVDSIPSIDVSVGLAGSLLRFSEDLTDGSSTLLGSERVGRATFVVRLVDGRIPELTLEDGEPSRLRDARLGSDEPFRLVWSAPAGVRVSGIAIRASGINECDVEGLASPFFTPPYSRPVAAAFGPAVGCLVLGESSSGMSGEPTRFVRGEVDGTHWAVPGATRDSFRCGGLRWDAEDGAFRAICSHFDELVTARSEECSGPWEIVAADPDDQAVISRALGYTTLGDEHEMWFVQPNPDAEGRSDLQRRWATDASFGEVIVDPLESLGDLPLDRALTLLRVGRDRVVLVGDGLGLSLWVVTGLEGDPPNVRVAFDPLIGPSGRVGTFDENNLTDATMSRLPSPDGRVRLLLIYSGSAYCGDFACGQHAGAATVTIESI